MLTNSYLIIKFLPDHHFNYPAVDDNLGAAMKSPAAIEIKGSTFTLTILRILTEDIAAIEAQLAPKIAQAPKFFHQAPVILDFLAVNKAAIDIPVLVQLLREHQVVPVGLCNASETQQAVAISLGLGIFQSDKNKPSRTVEVKEARPLEKAVESSAPAFPKLSEAHQARTGKVVSQPVRSGQRVCAPGTDLILLAPVSAGAEVLADGNIHIYAPLRGRALAGASGDTSARIFCQCLDAELISIAGNFLPFEKIDPQMHGKSVQIYLEGDQEKPQLRVTHFPNK